MEYNFSEVEKKWQRYWSEHDTFRIDIDTSGPKYYVLDMFPYPSGAGLHVGHPLGYIASDIYARFKRLKGFNVLHPMGFDAYGLPAEQYAIQTGTHPAVTTEKNILRYRAQMDKIGFSYDWSREVKTCDPDYYKWTQWTFIQLFNHWYNPEIQKAEPVTTLVKKLSESGFNYITSDQWKRWSEKEQQEFLMNYRLAYISDAMVNWCTELGTVLANDEVSNGFSVRGNHPVERKLMKQWFLRITPYAQRLLDGLDTVDWFDSLKEIQRNWIGRSEGADIFFPIKDHDDKLEIFTTRPDTIFGATYMVLAPEHELVERITTPDRKDAVREYTEMAKNRSDRERMADVKTITGEFTGAYCINPFNQELIPIWVAEYVLAGYGTGAIMAVPAHDQRDYEFAKHFGLPIIEVVSGGDISENSYDAKEGSLINSDFINGMDVKTAVREVIRRIEEMGIGKGTINFRLRDAIFSRQRYWGEPIPIYYKDGIPYPLPISELPLKLPVVDKFLPTETGEPPLARAEKWTTHEGYPLETATMPGFAGSSGYYLRYMDPGNHERYFSKEAAEYWQNVDLYIGGDEHASGHLIYARFWNKFLFDIGLTLNEEPFKKLINQGKIQGRSNLVYRLSIEKLGENLVWEAIKEKKLGVEFIRDFRDGKRRFDFYSEEANLIIEIKTQKNLEKIAGFYKELDWAKEYKILFLPLMDLKDNFDGVIDRIKEAIESNQVDISFEHEAAEIHPWFVSKNHPWREDFSTPMHVDVSMVDNDVLDIDAFRSWRPDLADAEFILEDGKYICGYAIEKMSKSLYNVVNPDKIIEDYGADTLRLYEMFLGPLEQSKPWDTNGIEGVFRFIRKVWRLYHDEKGRFMVTDETPTKDELRVIYRTIKKVQEDIERFSFNTAVSAFMICVNELSDLKCSKREILKDLAIILSPYTPHLAEELWEKLGHSESIAKASFPIYKEEYLIENTFQYPISFNGKVRFKLTLPLDLPQKEIEQAVLQATESAKWLQGKPPKKVIVVQGKIVNVVI
jgi:leucyl-tRNA synthetase